MLNPLLPDNRPKRPEMDFPFYTPFMEGRNQLEAMMEHLYKTPDYRENEITIDKRASYTYAQITSMGKYKFAEMMMEDFFVLLKEIYDDIKSKKPAEGKKIFYIGTNWTMHTTPTETGMDLVVWMSGAWVDSKFMDQPIQSPIVNHIPKEMMDGY